MSPDATPHAQPGEEIPRGGMVTGDAATRAAQNAEEQEMAEEKPTPDPDEAEVQDLPPEDKEAADVVGGSGPSGPGTGGWNRVKNPQV